MTFSVELGKTLLIQMLQGRKFSFWHWVFYRCLIFYDHLLRSLAHTLRRGSWHPSLGPIGVLWLVVWGQTCMLPLVMRWLFCSCRVFFCYFGLFNCFQEFVKIEQSFWQPRDVVAVIVGKPIYLCTCFFNFGNLTFAKNFWILWSWGAISCGVMVLPRNSTSVTPKWRFSIVSSAPDCLMHSKAVRMLRIKYANELATIPISSTCCAHWSALITLSKYFLIKLENADSARLNSCASLLYVNVLFAKLKASISIDLWSAICKQWYACEQSNLQNSFFQLGVALHLTARYFE